MAEKCAVIDDGKYNLLFFAIVLVVLFGGFYFLSTAMKTPATQQISLIQNGSTIAPEHNTISVSGSAKENVEPDLLVVSFYVESEDESAEKAQSDNAQAASAILSSLKSLGIDEKNIKTESYSLQTKEEGHYICRNESDKSDCYWTTEVVGYTVRHLFSVRAYDTSKGGAIVDAIGKNGGKVSSVYFDLKPETKDEVTARLLSAASANAKKKAEAMAKGIGVSISKPLSISESYSYYPIYYPTIKAALSTEMAGYAPTQIQSGTIEISASVSAVFEMQ